MLRNLQHKSDFYMYVRTSSFLIRKRKKKEKEKEKERENDFVFHAVFISFNAQQLSMYDYSF